MRNLAILVALVLGACVSYSSVEQARPPKASGDATARMRVMDAMADYANQGCDPKTFKPAEESRPYKGKHFIGAVTEGGDSYSFNVSSGRSCGATTTLEKLPDEVKKPQSGGATLYVPKPAVVPVPTYRAPNYRHDDPYGRRR
jgi:hypothetical protein